MYSEELAKAYQRISDLEKERTELWNQRDAAYASWQPLTEWDRLRKERDHYKEIVNKIVQIVT